MYEMGRDIHSRVLRSEKGCKIRVTQVRTRSDCVHTRNDTVRLDYASRFVRVIYSSHIVSIKLGTVTNRECFFLRHVELNSTFIVMIIDEVTLDRPEIDAGIQRHLLFL